MPSTTPHPDPPGPGTRPPLTQDLGRAERLLRAVLDRELRDSALAFPAWTVLATLGRGAQQEDAVVAALVGSRVGSTQDVRAALAQLRSDGQVVATASGTGPERLSLSPEGERTFSAVRDRVGRRTAELLGDLPAADLDATRRTLTTVADRATAMLARPA
jgi:DNA-binding MarR family transcriptional regulator